MIVSEEHSEFALVHLGAEFAQPVICQLMGALLEEPLGRQGLTDLKCKTMPYKSICCTFNIVYSSIRITGRME